MIGQNLGAIKPFGIVIALASSAGGIAYFFDIEESTGNTFQAGQWTNPDKSTDLIIGQNYDNGKITVWKMEGDLYVKYETTDGWEMTETQLYVGKTNPEQLTSAPGQFPYKENYSVSVTSDIYTIPLSEIDYYHLEGEK